MTTFGLGLRHGVAGVTIAGLLALSGCAGDDAGSGDTMSMMMTSTGGADSTGVAAAPTHDADIQPIWDTHCVTACHEAGGEWSLVDMAEGNAYEALVGVISMQGSGLALIEPGDVDMSYLWHKINFTQADAGGGGLNMPKPPAGGMATVMTDDEIETIRAWIEGGAVE
ncbi:MAG: hypothetical protein K0V04_15905 [Deltaproteobacteria bacterium]|nr:hypothetical protein [Deltaproteobacteria bacterium]